MRDIKNILEKFAKPMHGKAPVDCRVIAPQDFEELETELDRYMTTVIDNSIDDYKSSAEAR